jgi:hypothetical protein
VKLSSPDYRVPAEPRRQPTRESHRFERPDVREMKPSEIEAQRRLVRASLLRRSI